MKKNKNRFLDFFTTRFYWWIIRKKCGKGKIRELPKRLGLAPLIETRIIPLDCRLRAWACALATQQGLLSPRRGSFTLWLSLSTLKFNILRFTLAKLFLVNYCVAKCRILSIDSSSIEKKHLLNLEKIKFVWMWNYDRGLTIFWLELQHEREYCSNID